MARHILPNIISAALVFSMVDAVGNILLSAALGYLGLGVQEPSPEWGTMISDGQAYILTSWWVPTIPGVVIVIIGIALSLFGDGLAAYLRPRR
jgi:peptide/nickel transport system permease protein